MKNSNSTPLRKCIQCKCKIEGRSDKVFCGITCKNQYHKTQNTNRKQNAEPILQILHKNYFILEGLSDGKTDPFEIQKSYLAKLGYAFNYFTNKSENGQNSCFNFALDYLDNSKIKIHPPNQRKQHNDVFYERRRFSLNQLMNSQVS